MELQQYDSRRLEPDEKSREMQTFYNPYYAKILEGGSAEATKRDDIESVAILSAN